MAALPPYAVPFYAGSTAPTFLTETGGRGTILVYAFHRAFRRAIVEGLGMEIPKDKLAALTTGVNNTLFLMTRITEFKGNPAKTEYLLTADIARALVGTLHGHDVKVEYLNRRFLDAMTMLARTNPHKALRSKRTDVAVVHINIPLAIIEVKIRLHSARAIRCDLDKSSVAVPPARGPRSSMH
jgi:hypothetical protein